MNCSLTYLLPRVHERSGGRVIGLYTGKNTQLNNPYRVVTLVSVNSHALQTNQVTLADDAYLAGK